MIRRHEFVDEKRRVEKDEDDDDFSAAAAPAPAAARCFLRDRGGAKK
jgi:hypothetical protein